MVKRIIFIICAVLMVSVTSHAGFKSWTFNGLTGGGAALDGRLTIDPGSGRYIEDNDIAMGNDASDEYIIFKYDSASSASENTSTKPYVIVPDDNVTGTGRWIQINISIGGTIPADEIEMGVLGTPTYTSVQDWSDTTQSAGIISGGDITDGGSGTIDISAVTGVIKTTDSDIGSNLFFNLSGTTGSALTDESTNYVAVDYNSGTPQFIIGVSDTSDGHTIFNVGKVYREGTAVDIINSGTAIYDVMQRVQRHHLEESDLHFTSGATVSETGTLNIGITAGVLYVGLNRSTTDAIDTSVADDFEYYYYTGSAWTESDETDIDNLQYNNIGSGLATLTNNRYGVHWVYKGTNSTTYVVYGQGDYILGDAQAAQPPASLPAHVSDFGVLRAKIIIQKSASSFTEIESVTDTVFTSETPSDHNGLGGLQGGAAGEYYHATAAEYTIIGNTSGTNTGDDPADDTAYDATSWNGNTDAATKNAIRDKIETMGGGSTTITDLGDATANGAVDFVSYDQLWDINTGSLQIGDGGSNYWEFGPTGATLAGTYTFSANLVSDYITLTPAVTEPATTDGLLRNVTGLTGLGDTFGFWDGAGAQYFVNYELGTLAAGHILVYNTTDDEWDHVAASGDITIAEGGVFTIGAGTIDKAMLSSGAQFTSIAVADLSDTTTPSVLTTAETTNTCISNYKSSGADHVFTMAAAHTNGNVIFPIGDEFQVDIEPDSGENFYLNGTAMATDEHIQNAADTLGERIVGYCVNVNGALTWMFYSADAAWVEATP